MKLQIDVLRHGESELSAMLRGSTDDALTAVGWSQMAQTTAHSIQQQGPWQAIFSSPLQRCRLFATSIAEQYQLPIYLDPNLAEIHFGDWEGRSTQAIYDSSPELLSQFWQQPSAYTPPNAEPFLQFHQRVLQAMAQIEQQMQAEQLKRVLVVSHGGVIKLLKTIALELPLDSVLSQTAALGQIHHFEYTANRALQYCEQPR
ncbi:alpha-ribazole phosphatase [Acinetobacter calcoaceticus]|uniref:Alpha-ribazole phosphatase n=1 Tax=Acinetobacter calcoaceticus TaxID=471 RepID=A0A4R1Y070_ACICA|nr:alpha-ribazole phosphatase [Acinetobacter calcoaceticus]